jgi:hypothetical protein
MDNLTLKLLGIIRRIYTTTHLQQEHESKPHKKNITIVHILYKSAPLGYTEDSMPSELICWPMLADKLTLKYCSDKTVNLNHIIFNIDSKFGHENDILLTALDKKIISMHMAYPKIGFHHKLSTEMFTTPSRIISQLKLLTSELPDDIAINLVYFGNYADLNCNPFQLTRHNPRIFAPPYDGNVNHQHMHAEISFNAVYSSIRWLPDTDLYSYELRDYKIPALLELIQLHNRKITCPVTNQIMNIHDMIDIPLTHASSTMTVQKIDLIKVYLHIIFTDSKLLIYMDDLVDEIASSCMIDILQTYIIHLGGVSGADSFQHPITIMTVMLLESIAEYRGYPHGSTDSTGSTGSTGSNSTHSLFNPVTTAISQGKIDELIDVCQVLVQEVIG